MRQLRFYFHSLTQLFSPKGQVYPIPLLLFIVAFQLLRTSIICAQTENLTYLHSNPVVSGHYQAAFKKHHIIPPPPPIPNDTLPFLDDFSKPGPYPDSTKWMDRNVYINNTFPIAPPSIGVATFDGLDSTGYPYDFTASGTDVAAADYLTSRPINLAKWNTAIYATTVYLSFFYQAQGRGIFPKPQDSLVLEFKLADSTHWDYIWSHVGYEPAFNDTGFHPVIVPLLGNANGVDYLANGFQFRFRNYACPCGNVDHWNIDYVYLDKNRNPNDTTFQDVAFAYNPSSLLTNYQAMPWRQYQKSELRDSLVTWIRNNFDTTLIRSYSYTIDSSGFVKGTDNSNADNIYTFKYHSYCNWPPFEHPPLNYTIPPLHDSTEYIWTSSLSTASDDFDQFNDTVRFTQKFKNYYAYDDGSAELAYYMAVSGTFNPSVCLRYHLNVADTVKAIEIFFDPVVANASLSDFRLGIWNDNKGLPGTQLYVDTIQEFPDYLRGTYNQFATYTLADTNFILQPGDYYFGVIQDKLNCNDPSGADCPLDIGYDVNTNAVNNTFVNLSGSWQPSAVQIPGSLMIRPVFGANNHNVTGIQPIQASSLNFSVYPNPAGNNLNITMNLPDKQGRVDLSLLDAYGNLLYQQTNYKGTSIDMSQFTQGVYFVKVNDQEANSAIRRVVVIHP